MAMAGARPWAGPKDILMEKVGLVMGVLDRMGSEADRSAGIPPGAPNPDVLAMQDCAAQLGSLSQELKQGKQRFLGWKHRHRLIQSVRRGKVPSITQLVEEGSELVKSVEASRAHKRELKAALLSEMEMQERLRGELQCAYQDARRLHGIYERRTKELVDLDEACIRHRGQSLKAAGVPRRQSLLALAQIARFESLNALELELGLPRIEFDDATGVVQLQDSSELDEEPDPVLAVCVQFGPDGKLCAAEAHPSLSLQAECAAAVARDDLPRLLTAVWHRAG